MSLVTTALALIIGSFCAYALARLRFKGKFLILALVLSITTFPAIAIAAPLFRLWSDIGIYNTLIGLIIPNLTFALPLAIYILVSFFKEIPKDLEEAALVDGATYFQAFRKVVVPLAAPGLATAGILTFIATWNEFLLAITLTSSPSARTVPAAIAFFTGVDAVRDPLRDDHGGVGDDLDPADSHGPAVPEADRGGPDGRSRQGLSMRCPAAVPVALSRSGDGRRGPVCALDGRPARWETDRAPQRVLRRSRWQGNHAGSWWSPTVPRRPQPCSTR